MTASGGHCSVRFWETDPKINHSSGGSAWPNPNGRIGMRNYTKLTGNPKAAVAPAAHVGSTRFVGLRTSGAAE
jgi:hypothetical protein